MHTSIVFFIATHVYLTPMQSTHWKIGKCFWIRFITTSTLIYIITKITTCIYTGIYIQTGTGYILRQVFLLYFWYSVICGLDMITFFTYITYSSRSRYVTHNMFTYICTCLYPVLQNRTS